MTSASSPRPANSPSRIARRATVSPKLVALKRSHRSTEFLRSSSSSGSFVRYGSPRSIRSFSDDIAGILTRGPRFRPASDGSFNTRELAIHSSDRGGGRRRPPRWRHRPRLELLAPRRLYVLARVVVEADRRDLR